MSKIKYTIADFILTKVPNGSTVFIRNVIDLEGKQINLPPNLTLNFAGGKIINGTLRGDNTLLIGEHIGNISATLSNSFRNFGKIRPTTLGTNDKGFQFFDTNINKPKWWTGSKWVDANGTDADVPL